MNIRHREAEARVMIHILYIDDYAVWQVGAKLIQRK